MFKLSGVIAATATPVKPDLRIDLDRLIHHCRWLLEAGGCDGINLLGTTGEATSFPCEERLLAMRAVASSGLPLDRMMVGTGAAAFEDACRLTAEAKFLGFGGALLLPPFYYKGLTETDVFEFVDVVIKTVGRDGLRLYLYHFPSNSGVPFSLETVGRLRDAHPDQVLGLKDSSGVVEYAAGMTAALPGFAVFPSSEQTLGRAFELGFAGCISATANVTGPQAQIAWSGTDLDSKAGALRSATAIRAHLVSYPLVAAVKASLALMKDDMDWVRTVPPLTALSRGDTDRLWRKLVDLRPATSRSPVSVQP